MLTLYSNDQAECLVVNGRLEVDDNIEIAFDGFKINADIKCYHLSGTHYNRDLQVIGNIDAASIRNFRNIKTEDINVGDIDVININARNITAEQIDAANISYYAVCFAYKDIFCDSIKGRRKNSKHFSLDGDVIINNEIGEKL